MGPLLRELRNGKSATSRSKFRHGTRSCAFNAESAYWSARTPSFAQKSTTSKLLAKAPPRSSPPSRAGGRWTALKYTLQVAPEDCTGCTLCVEVCPAKSKSEVKHKAINMVPQPPLREPERRNWEFFLSLPEFDRDRLSPTQVKDVQLLEPLFEFTGACAGCGETPYIKLLTQLFGDRAADRQRDGLFFDLRRQPADDALHDKRSGPRAGLVQFAV